MTLLINEIFQSIQGESLFTGLPCVFIRLTGCNLRCTYCDTEYAYHEGTKMSISEIIQKVETFGCNLVEITGGEPLLQENTPLLIESLLTRNHKVLIETNGSMDIGILDKRCIKIMDLKCPSSGEDDKNNFQNIEKLGQADQIKFVIKDKTDYDYVKKLFHTCINHIPETNILLSPVTGELHPSKLAEWILKDKINCRLHLQLHKTIWPNTERGV